MGGLGGWQLGAAVVAAAGAITIGLLATTDYLSGEAPRTQLLSPRTGEEASVDDPAGRPGSDPLSGGDTLSGDSPPGGLAVDGSAEASPATPPMATAAPTLVAAISPADLAGTATALFEMLGATAINPPRTGGGTDAPTPSATALPPPTLATPTARPSPAPPPSPATTPQDRPAGQYVLAAALGVLAGFLIAALTWGRRHR
jgi:hypothetical protein